MAGTARFPLRASRTLTVVATAAAKERPYYALPEAYIPGIYRNYRTEVLPNVKGIPGALAKKCKCDTAEEAQAYMDAYKKGASEFISS